MTQVVEHYTREGVREGLKILGCLDLVGNPVKFFGHISAGVEDLFYEPFLDGVQSMTSNTIGESQLFLNSPMPTFRSRSYRPGHYCDWHTCRRLCQAFYGS